MWFEILAVFAAIASILSFFGLPAKRIAQLIKQYITWSRLSFILAIIVTTGVLYIQVLSILYLRPIGWGLAALVLWLLFVVWKPIIDTHFSSWVILGKVTSLLASFGSIPALIVVFITWDESVWRKAASIGGGFVIGYAVATLERYVRRRRAVRTEN